MMCCMLFFIILDLVMAYVIYYNVRSKMYRRHNLEYYRNIRYMRLFMLIILLMFLYYLRVGISYGSEFFSEWHDRWTIFYMYDRQYTIEAFNKYSEYGWFIYIALCYGTTLPFISLILIHVCFKPDDDIL